MVKRILLGLLSFTIWCNYALSQSMDAEVLKHSDIYFLKNSGESVTLRDSADFIRVISPPDSVYKNAFVVRDFYKNGKPKLIGRTLTPEVMLKRQGMFVEYYPNGHRKLIENYDNGWRVGDVTYFYPNGRVYYVSNYDKDKKLDFINEANDSTGTAVVTNGNGTWTEYSDDFKFIKGKGVIVNGLKEGEWQGTPNDSVTYTCTYKQGSSVSGVSYTKSGKEYHFTKDIAEPGPKGGIEKFYQFLARNIRYPAEAKEHNIQGKVWSTFTVEKDGRLTNIKILQGIGHGCNEEVQRVLSLSSPWEPEYQYGIPVKEIYRVPISFALAFDNH